LKEEEEEGTSEAMRNQGKKIINALIPCEILSEK
jgi:hypothetical protein